MAGAGYRDWTAGEKPTAVMFDQYLQEQTIMRFASAAARNAALAAVVHEGMMAWLDDVNCMTQYTGSAWSTIGPTHGVWSTYSPSWTANGGSAPSLGNGTIDGFYQRFGRKVDFSIRLVMGSTTTFGSGSSPWRFTIPVAAGGSTWEQVVHDAVYFDATAAAPTQYFEVNHCGVIDTSSTFVEFRGLFSSSIAWATGDKVLINGTYQCGSDG